MSTIAAISTAPGAGGIGIIRMSGKEAFCILKRIFKTTKEWETDTLQGHTIKYGHILKEGEVIDEVLVSFFTAPHSYTTEDVCEINSHGGTYVVQKILEVCLENGAELAEPGEFTQRAFLNGRMDLSQAEAVMDIIKAKTQKEAKSSIQQLEGYLSNQIQKIREKLMELMVQIEVSIDYPEYDVEEVQQQKAREKLEEVEQGLEKLRESFANGKIVKEGIKVALIGRPNVGKSSLLNAILKEERAIVTQMEGTTRDTIEESITVEGIPIHIIDTAGIRQATNEVEKIGIEKSKKMVEEAELIIAIFDASRTLEKEDKEILALLRNKKSIIILNKKDLGKNNITKQEIRTIEKEASILSISAKEAEGIEAIYQEIVRIFKLEEINLDDSAVVTNLRHKNSILKAIEQLQKAKEAIQYNLPIDICAISIKEMMEELGKITGESVTEDIIKEIFSKFCLGK